MKDAYSQRAAEWAAWAREKQAGFERRDFEDLNRAARELAAFKKIEKPAKIQEKLELAQVFTSILAKSRGAWQPPEAISPQAIDGLYAEHEYELALRAALSRRRRLDALLKLWRGMEQFVLEHAAMLAIEQTKIKMQDAFADELAANADRLAKARAGVPPSRSLPRPSADAQVGELREQVVAAAPLASHHPEVNRRTDAVMEAWETLKIQSAKLKEALAKELAVQQRLEETRLAYASKAEARTPPRPPAPRSLRGVRQAVHGALEDLIDTAQEPVDAYSSEEAQARHGRGSGAPPEYPPGKGRRRPYPVPAPPGSPLPPDCAPTQRLLDQRAKAVELEIVRQAENERLCRSFADDSARLLAACKEAPQDAVKIIAAGASPEESARHLETREKKSKLVGTAASKAKRLAKLDRLQGKRPPSGEATNASAQGPGARPKRPAERPEVAASTSPRNKENCNRIENTAGPAATPPRSAGTPKASPRAPLRTLQELSTAAANKSETTSAGARRDSAGDSTPPQGSASSPQHSSPGTGEPPAQRRKLGDQILRDVEKYELWNAFHNYNVLPLVQECNRLRQECQEKDRAIAEQQLELESVRGRAFQYKHLYEREKDKRTEELPSSDQQQLHQLQAEDARAVRFWLSLPEDVRGLHVPRKELLEAAASTTRHRVGVLYSLILYLSGEQGTDEGGRWGENAYRRLD
eukprot:tig00021098_g18208.t1